jgi:YtcA family
MYRPAHNGHVAAPQQVALKMGRRLRDSKRKLQLLHLHQRETAKAGAFAYHARTCLISIGVFFLESCSSSHHRTPSIDVFGSYFPAWLISLAVAVVFTVIASSAGRLVGIRVSGFLGFLLCVSLILIFSISVWFLLFSI